MVTEVGAVNPVTTTSNCVPGGPCEAPPCRVVAVMVWLCAFAIGTNNTVNVNMLRKSSTSVALINLFSVLIERFCKWVAPHGIDCFFANIRFRISKEIG